MSKPLSRKKFITKLDAYPTSDDSFVYRQLLAHDASLRAQLATVTLASRTAVEINHVHEDEIDTLREQLATMTQERDAIAARWKEEFELRCTREEVAEQLHILYLAKAHDLGWTVRHECDVPYDRLTPDGQALDLMFADWHLAQMATLREQLATVTEERDELHKDFKQVYDSYSDAVTLLHDEQKVSDDRRIQLATVRQELQRYTALPPPVEGPDPESVPYWMYRVCYADRERIRQAQKEAQQAFKDVREDMDTLKQQTIEVVRTERQEVWEEAAHAFDKKFYATDRQLDNTRDYRVDEFYTYCRSQAQKEAP